MKARKRTVDVCVINIAMQSPHAPERYLALFREVVRLDRPIALRGNHAAQITCRFPRPEEGIPEFLYGTIDKYFDLKKDDPWFNRRASRKAEKDELAPVENLPDELKPSYESLIFVFHLKSHKLFLLSREAGEGSMSPGQAGVFLDTLFNQTDLLIKFGNTAVTVIPQKGSLDWIFGFDTIRRVEIEFFAPNADDDDDLEESIVEKLDRLHAKQMSEIYVARDNESLEIDVDVKRRAEVATKNGYVLARGLDVGGKVGIRSSIDKPFVDKFTYIPKLITRYDALIEKARELLNRGF